MKGVNDMKDYRAYIKAKLEERMIEEINSKNITVIKTCTKTVTYTPHQWLARPKTSEVTSRVWDARKCLSELELWRALAALLIVYKKWDDLNYREKIMLCENREAIEMLLNKSAKKFKKVSRKGKYPKWHPHSCYKRQGSNYKTNVEDLNFLAEQKKMDFEQKSDFDFFWQKIKTMRYENFILIHADLRDGIIKKLDKYYLNQINDDDIFNYYFQLINCEIDVKKNDDKEWLAEVIDESPNRLYMVAEKVKNWKKFTEPYKYTGRLESVNVLMNFVEPTQKDWDLIFKRYYESAFQIINRDNLGK